jgi:hypothetical protein
MTNTAQCLIVAAPVLVMGARSPARAASTELCAQFDRECTEARPAGYRTVTRYVTSSGSSAPPMRTRVPKASHETRDEDQRDPRRPLENGRSGHGITRLAA